MFLKCELVKKYNLLAISNNIFRKSLTIYIIKELYMDKEEFKSIVSSSRSLSDVSYTDKRAEKILYPSLAMGTEEYYLFITPDNREVLSSDHKTLDGRKVGVNRDSIQKDFYLFLN